MADENGNGNGSAEFKTPIFSASFRGKDVQLRDVILLLILGATALTAYAFWEHKTDRREADTMLAAAIRELSVAQRAQTSAQREMNCLISLPQDKREAEFNSSNGLCKRISRDAY